MNNIIINDLSYHHQDKQLLFSNISFSVNQSVKAALIGNNGIGKSTLLRIISGELAAASGVVSASSKTHYIPQHTGVLNKTVAEALQVNVKMAAMAAITAGSVNPADFEALNDDWDIEAKTLQALAYWELTDLNLQDLVDELSGGEKTKVFLAGLLIHQPEIILLDEPTNHLDAAGREQLYRFVEQSKATVLVVSHDITLLNKLDVMYEFTTHGIKQYGGNYTFYEQQKEIEQNALTEDVDAEQKALRLARKKAREVELRQEKRTRQGEKNKAQVIRILRKTKLNAGENTQAKLGDKHNEIVEGHKNKLSNLRQQQGSTVELKLNFNDADLHRGKQLVIATELNFAYQPDGNLWQTPVSVELLSGDRLHVKGKNASGKTTLVKLLLGELQPTEGEVKKADFTYVYLDQNYEQLNVTCSVLELAERYNIHNLEEHEIKMRLNRFLFPLNTWDKNCLALSGGEKMRLNLCCLMISNYAADMFVLDEPSNNLDIASLKILINTMKNYDGTVLLISHDSYFASEIGMDKELLLE